MKYLKTIVVISLLFGLWSCGEDEEITNTLEVDAYIRAMKIDGKIKYAPVFLSRTSTAPANLTATDASNRSNSVFLTSYWNNKLTQRWVPDTINYKEAFDASKTYEFIASFDNEEKDKEASETVSLSDVPKAFEVTEAVYNKEDKKLHITWTNANADTYMIQVTTAIDESPLFQSINLNVDAGDGSQNYATEISLSSLKWFQTPGTGKEYLLSIHAFNLQSSDKIRGEFIAGKRFPWGK